MNVFLKILLRRCFDKIRIDSGCPKGSLNTRNDLAKYGNNGDSFQHLYQH